MRTLCGTILAAAVAVFTVGAGAAQGGFDRPTGELQEKAQALADLAVKEGLQGALQFCAFKDGKCIVDVWAGTMTTNAGAAKIDGDTLFPIFSTEKPLLATAVHRSVEQGKLEYDKPVCKYWPEFRGGGKENLTVRELMGYRSGLPDCKPGTGWHDFAIMSDWKGMLEWYASSVPQIEPGTKQRYMPRSYGWALGGLLEKAWGRPANDILREQVLVPAGIEKDFYFVCGDDEIPRIAEAYNGNAFESMNNDIARRSFLPSAWAVSSARGIAKFYNRLCGFDGQPPLVGKATLDAALKPCRHESDPLPDAEGLKKWHMIFGMGYGLWGEADDISRVFGHGGVGGSEGLCDRSQRLVIGYTCNFDNAPPKLREAFYSLVGMRWRYWKDDVNIQDLQMSTVTKGNAASANSVASPGESDAKCAWFREARFGMFIHWGIYSIPGKGEWSYALDKYAPGEYEANAKIFNPVDYTPREWAKLAKAAGMKYAVLTSRHHDGFCMFDSHFTDYKITNSPYGRDAVREFLEAFRAEGLKVGLYHSLPDWTHPGYADTESPECIAGGKKEPHMPTPEQYASFTNLVYNHINQLTTEYGKIDLLFLDYTSRTKADIDYFGRDGILEMVYRNQSGIIVNDRLSYFKDNCRDFDYYTPEICVPNQPLQVKGREVAWETCATMNDNWGYCRADENWKTPEAVISGLVGCVSKNGNLLLNVGPTEKGSIPAGSENILKALADWYEVNGESVTGCGKSDFTPPYGCVYTQKGNTLYCHFLQSPLGDTILPQLKGKIEKAALLRTGEPVELIDHWGFELLKPDEQRIRTRAIRPGDVVKMELKKDATSAHPEM